MRIFRTATGYLGWVEGLGTVEASTLRGARRESRRLVASFLAGAFPDRPDLEPVGALEVLRFSVELRARGARSSATVRDAS